MKKAQVQNYFDLTENNTIQNIVFLVIVLLLFCILSYFIYPILEWLFIDYLKGAIYNSGEDVSYTLGDNKLTQTTNLYYSWAIDVYKNTDQEARYWFNPVVSLLLPTLTLSSLLGFLITTLLPQNFGLAHKKIEREIASILDKICLSRFGYHSQEDRDQIAKDLLNADLRNLHDYEIEWGTSLSDLITIHKAIKWKAGNLLYKLLHINDGISLYLKLYFNIQYSNSILGLVYVGAAVLIVIIGLRGLKFIPATEPSLVFFALGLEFSLLITYAVTLMYARVDELSDLHINQNNDVVNLDKEFSDSKELESLLRVFIFSDTKSSDSQIKNK